MWTFYFLLFLLLIIQGCFSCTLGMHIGYKYGHRNGKRDAINEIACG